MNQVLVTAPSRLHFGVFSLPPGKDWPADKPERYFGGVGMMVEAPGIKIAARQAENWSAEGPLNGARALGFAKRFCETIGCQKAFAIRVLRCAPEHVGLGTGTQLGLATARAVALATGHEDLGAVGLARWLGRGKRSALGIHGFAQGGFLVEAGKRSATDIGPLVARLDFPEAWRVLLILPQDESGLAGIREKEAFAYLTRQAQDRGRTERLCRIALLGMLPALAECDLETFGEALYEFNRGVGEWFAPWQGGIYAHPRTANLVEVLRGQNVRGAGQSSWGPGVFAIVAGDEAADLSDWLLRKNLVQANEMIVTRAANQGATVERNSFRSEVRTE